MRPGPGDTCAPPTWRPRAPLHAAPDLLLLLLCLSLPVEISPRKTNVPPGCKSEKAQPTRSGQAHGREPGWPGSEGEDQGCLNRLRSAALVGLKYPSGSRSVSARGRPALSRLRLY